MSSVKKTGKKWEQYLTTLGAFWFHDGNPKRPHALLTEGGHSNGFFNGSLIAFDYPNTARDMCKDLAQKMFRQIFSGGEEDEQFKILGPEYGANTMSAFLAAELGIGYVLVRPEGKGEDKIVTLDKRFKVQGIEVVRVEDTITTGGTLKKCRPLIEEQGGHVSTIIGAWCNRSGLTEVDGSTIIALIDKNMPVWKPDDCPLCRLGSEAIRPKQDDNWNLLTKAY